MTNLFIDLFQNMIEKPEESQVIKENCISMVQCRVMKQLEFLEQRKFEDEDIQVSFALKLIKVIKFLLIQKRNFQIRITYLDQQIS